MAESQFLKRPKCCKWFNGSSDRLTPPFLNLALQALQVCILKLHDLIFGTDRPSPDSAGTRVPNSLHSMSLFLSIKV